MLVYLLYGGEGGMALGVYGSRFAAEAAIDRCLKARRNVGCGRSYFYIQDLYLDALPASVS